METKKVHFYLLTLIFLFLSEALFAQNRDYNKKAVKDTVKIVRLNTKEEKGRNVMLSASSNTGAREINIGLPATAAGTTIRENGLSVAFLWPERAGSQWASGVGLGRMGLLSLGEASITSGDFGYAVNSYTRLGGDAFKINGSVTGNHFGWLKNDISMSGPVKKGLSYSIGLYSNMDPGPTKMSFTNIANKGRMYRIGLTKYFNNNKGKISLLYRYSFISDISESAISIYKEGGKIEKLDNFKIGRDSYILNTGKFHLLDAETGEYYDFFLGSDDVGTKCHSLFITGNNNLNNNWNLDYVFNYRHSDCSLYTLNNQSISTASASDNFTYMDGTTYTGEVQSVMISHAKSIPMNTIQAKIVVNKKTQKHNIRIGLMDIFSDRDRYHFNRSFFYKEVAANPQQLTTYGASSSGFKITDINGFYNYNKNTTYNDGKENKLSFFILDDYEITPRFVASYGINLRYHKLKGNYCSSPRTNGFTFEDAEYTDLDYDWFNVAATANLGYNITKMFGINGEVIYTEENAGLNNCNFNSVPSNFDEKTQTSYRKIGVFLNHPKISIVSALTYLTRNNYKATLNLVNPNNASETESVDVGYDIKTTGWVTDIITKPVKNFNLHFRFTLQDPVYDNYSFEAFGNEYSYNENNVLQISKVMMEIDPSVTLFDKKVKVWASLRSFSKQYANLTNVLYFKGWWESFAGVDYNINKHFAANVKIVNPLNQEGVKNEIKGAELGTDASEYYGQYIVSSYIRPFTLEATLSYKF